MTATLRTAVDGLLSYPDAMAHPEYSIVVGCGRLGSRLASQLSWQGHDVVVIDLYESAFRGLAPEFSGFRIVGNAAEFAVLQQAKVDRANSLLAVTGEDNLNLMVAQTARVVFHVERVLARVIDPAREAAYQAIDVATVCPTPLVTAAFLQRLEALSTDSSAQSL
ncbi:MAG: TrkA family potassium uptake protein [Cyanobacteria bacterium J06628_6]